jgi:hypothetical protein
VVQECSERAEPQEQGLHLVLEPMVPGLQAQVLQD